MNWRTLETRDVAGLDPVMASAWRERGYWDNETIVDYLQRWRSQRPDAIALAGDFGNITWSVLAGQVDRFAAGLQHLGVKRGHVVAVQLPNGPEFVVAYLAIARVQAVMQTIHMPYQGAELDFLLQHGGAIVAIGLSSFKSFSPVSHMLAASQAQRGPRHVIALGSPIPGTTAFGALMSGENGPGGLDARKSGDAGVPAMVSQGGDAGELPFLLLYTSGTTANPKGVPHAYRNFLANSRLSAKALAVTPDDRLLSLAPMTHLYGLFVMHLALMTGARQVLMSVFAPAEFAQVVERHAVSQVYAAPAHLAATLTAGLMDQHDFSSVRFVCLSGSAVAPSLAAQVESRLPNGKAIQLWGMSELQAGSFSRLDETPEVRHQTAGSASPGTELRVVDGKGQLLPAGEEGALQVRGPSLFAGYLDNPTATAMAFKDQGWFDTGDTARLSAAGHLTLTGRVTETINRGAVKFNPIDVELVLDTHPKVERSAMVPMPDPVLGERACLFVVRRVTVNEQLTLTELCNWLDQHGISKLKWPERIEFVDMMPMTPTQKIQRGRLQDRLREIDQGPAAGQR